jgi:two-component system alkaline phosphatase synthesis response regulator PhoP/two-component system response regulator VicR
MNVRPKRTPAASAARETRQDWQMQKTVLVVDDQPHIVRLIQVNLEKEGFRVATAEDGAAGFEKVQELRPDLVILDVIMPRKDGFEVLREIKADPQLAETPVIMLTVKSHNADIVEGLKEGAELYLPKPFHPKELVVLVKRVLETEASLADG